MKARISALISPATYPVISVVIPTCQRPDLLSRCLRALIKRDPGPSCEIIVVDDGRSIEVRALVNALARQHEGIRYLCPPKGRRGPAAARNAGWQAARGEIIAFTDDDTLPAPDWLNAGFKALAPGVAAASGHVRVPLPERPTDAERETAGLQGAEFVTANCFVRRSALVRSGGFDERYTRPWREDSDLYFTLLEQGETVVAAPEAVVVHPPRTAPAIDCLRRHRNLVFDALLYKKHPRLYREKIAAGPPLHYYLALLLALGALLALALGRPEPAGVAALAWLALTGWLARRRQRGLSRHWRERIGIALTSVLIPPLAVFWRLAGAWRFRVFFA